MSQEQPVLVLLTLGMTFSSNDFAHTASIYCGLIGGWMREFMEGRMSSTMSQGCQLPRIRGDIHHITPIWFVP